MIHIAIVDDNQQDLICLKEFLERYQHEQGLKIKISVFSDGDGILNNYRSKYDIILMDVEMRFVDGMTAAEEIRKVDPRVIIIFITNMAQYAIKGYTVDALDYVLKPVTYFAFSQRIDRALSRMQNRTQRFIIVNLKDRTLRLDVSKIYYIEIHDHNLTYHTFDGNYSTLGTIKDAEEKLAESNFFRTSKGYLVNLEHVESFYDNVAVVGGDNVIVSRSRKKDFLDTLNNYINEVGK